MKGAAYYRDRGRRRKKAQRRQKEKQTENLLVLMLYLIFLPVIGLVKLLVGYLENKKDAKLTTHNTNTVGVIGKRNNETNTLKPKHKESVNYVITSEATSESIKITWKGNWNVIIRRNLKDIADINNATSFEDDNLQSNTVYNYELTFIDEHYNESIQHLKIKTNGDAHKFTGMATGVFYRGLALKHRGDFSLYWKGDLSQKVLQITYKNPTNEQGVEITDTDLYFRDSNHEYIFHDTIPYKPNKSTTNDMHKKRLTIPKEAVSLNSKNSDLEIINITVVDIINYNN